jgi:hypothetical protein
VHEKDRKQPFDIHGKWLELRRSIPLHLSLQGLQGRIGFRLLKLAFKPRFQFFPRGKAQGNQQFLFKQIRINTPFPCRKAGELVPHPLYLLLQPGNLRIQGIPLGLHFIRLSLGLPG